MTALLTNRQEAIAALCRRFGVVQLDLFGSAAEGTFAADRSDFDFVADFTDPAPTVEYADRVLDFSEALEQLLGRRVDIVTVAALGHSRFGQTIAAMRQPVYDASRSTAA